MAYKPRPWNVKERRANREIGVPGKNKKAADKLPQRRSSALLPVEYDTKVIEGSQEAFVTCLVT